MARNLIDLIDADEDYDFEEVVTQKRFRKDVDSHKKQKRQIFQERKKLRKQKEDIQNIFNESEEEYV